MSPESCNEEIMVTRRIKYPLGIQTFSEIIEENYLYVDKTELVYDLVNYNKYVFLSRPRRFGKSLLLSTIRSYFEGRKELFEGLAIGSLEKKWTVHPVLRFDLSAANYDHPDVLKSKLSSYLRELERDYGVDTDPTPALGDRFRELIRETCRKAGRKVVILIDEYDKPMLDSLHDDELNSKLKSDLRGFYSTLKECDEYIRFAMLTGVTKFGKVSIFSGLNNITDISMLPGYDDICGITQQELLENFLPSVKVFAEYNGMAEQEVLREFKEFYDGYHFSRGGVDIYNPFSTLHAFAHNDFGSYWFSSGSPSYLIKLIERTHFVLNDLDNPIRSESALSDITDTSRDIVPLLYQSGYLTIKSYDPKTRLYTLGFPNREVSEGFWDSLSSYFFRQGRSMTEFDLYAFVDNLERGDAEKFMLRMKSLFASISSEHEPDKEVHFQNMVTILVKMLGFSVSAEVHSSYGRSDIEIKTPQYIYIIELKLGGSAEEAYAQICDKGYAEQYAVDARTKVLIGANFSKDTRTLTDWKISETK